MAAKTLSPKQSLFVGVTLFSMFFGAGNLILPPLVGLQAGAQGIPAMVGFLITGIGLPVLGIVAVALAGTLFSPISLWRRSIWLLVRAWRFRAPRPHHLRCCSLCCPSTFRLRRCAWRFPFSSLLLRTFWPCIPAV